MTANGGKSWALTTQRDLEVNSIAVHPDAPNRVFIGTNNESPRNPKIVGDRGVLL